MSGHGGRGGQGGRGGPFNCSGRSARGGSNHSNNHNKKKTIEDYYYIGSAKQASDFNLTTDQVINHTKKEYDRGVDVAEALRKGQEPDLREWQPSLRIGTTVDESIKAVENKQFKMLFKAELEEYMRMKRVFADNKIQCRPKLMSGPNLTRRFTTTRWNCSARFVNTPWTTRSHDRRCRSSRIRSERCLMQNKPKGKTWLRIPASSRQQRTYYPHI